MAVPAYPQPAKAGVQPAGLLLALSQLSDKFHTTKCKQHARLTTWVTTGTGPVYTSVAALWIGATRNIWIGTTSKSSTACNRAITVKSKQGCDAQQDW